MEAVIVSEAQKMDNSHKHTQNLVWKDIKTTVVEFKRTMLIVRDDLLAQASEEFGLVKDQSGSQIADVLYLVTTTEIQRGELAGDHMTQSLGAIVIIDD